MAKITLEQREKYAQVQEHYKMLMEKNLAYEDELIRTLGLNEKTDSQKRLSLADHNIDIASIQLLVSNISVALLGIKNEDSLIEARKIMVKAIRYIEDCVTNLLDVPFSEYEAKLLLLNDFDYAKRFKIIRKLGFGIQSLEEAFGDNSKYAASFIEIWGRLATVAKNLINLKTIVSDLDFSSKNRDLVLQQITLVKDLFKQCADQYRKKYELYTHKRQDFRTAIVYLQALKRLHIIIGERTEAETLKKKIEIWTNKLESDQRKTDGNFNR